MNSVIDRIGALEEQTLALSRRVRAWQTAFVLAVIGLGVIHTFPVAAQQPGNTIRGLLTVMSQDGKKPVAQLGQLPSGETELALYNNGVPAVAFRTTGKTYKDADDAGENYLNLYETYLYRYPPNKQPEPMLTSSLGLTRAGGSLVLWSANAKEAARLTARRVGGGSLMLFDLNGNPK